MQVSQAMSKGVRIANPNQSIRDAARLMASIDAGVYRSAKTIVWSA